MVLIVGSKEENAYYIRIKIMKSELTYDLGGIYYLFY